MLEHEINKAREAENVKVLLGIRHKILFFFPNALFAKIAKSDN
jgi:hypothetical protein